MWFTVFMFEGHTIAAVMPAYNTARTIARALHTIPRPLVDSIIVVNDGSRDETRAIAEGCPGVTVITHEKNRGYGGAQKTGYKQALAYGADIVVMVHADLQYDPALLPHLVAPIASGRADVCFGSRMVRKRDALKGGMPLWRFIANIVLTQIEDAVLHLGLSEYHTGYRAYHRSVLERLPLDQNSNNYVFDTEVIAQLRAGDFRVAEISIPTRYAEDSCSPGFWKSVEYGCSTLRVLAAYLLHRTHLRHSSLFVPLDPPAVEYVAPPRPERNCPSPALTASERVL